MPGADQAVANDRYLSLDSLRGIAALGVVFLHMRDFGYLAASPVFREGRLFVDFFFVLSGFVIAAAYGDKLASGFSRRTFLFLRLGRLYPLHIAIIAVFLVLEFAVMRPVLHDGHPPGMMVRAIFLLDAFFGLGNWFNGVSWSISVEMVMYCLAALLFGMGRRGVALAVALMIAAMAAQIAGFDPPGFTQPLQRGIVGFGTGVGCFYLHRRLARPSAVAASIAEAVVLILAGAMMVLTGPTRFAYLASVPAFAAVVVVFARDSGAISRFLAWRPFVALGAWSYSIYMIHLLIITTINHVLPRLMRSIGRPDLIRQSQDIDGLRRIALDPWSETAISIAVALLVVLVAAQTYRFIEEPGRRWARDRARAAGARGAERIAPTI